MVTLARREDLGMASLLMRRGASVHRLAEQLGLPVPQVPRRVVSGAFALASVGPGAFLATHEEGSGPFLAALRPVAGVSVSDQSDAYSIWRLSGPGVRRVLSRIVPLDLHPSVFEVDAVAVTSAGHMGATLWRLEDGAGGEPVFEIAVYRSYADYFERLLAGVS